MVTNTHPTIDLLIETGYFLRDPCRDIISKGQIHLREFCNGGCEDRTREHGAKEFPLLEAVAKERLVKTKHAGNG
jgi:hypothetical protein